MNIAMGIIYLLAMGCTSFLFLRRLHAVYHEWRKVCWIYSFAWFCISCLTVTVPIGVDIQHIGGTEYCIVFQIHSYTAVSEFLPVVFDTLVFSAVSCKLILDRDLRNNRNLSVSGHIHVVAQVLLRGGQQYYM